MEKPTVILFEGFPYRLMKITPRVSNDPCKVCDLRTVCSDCSLMNLCQPDGYDTSWAFVEDWNIHDNYVYDLL